MPRRQASGRAGGGSRSATSSATTSFTEAASRPCSAAGRRSTPIPPRLPRRDSALPDIEEEANVFAAALLMPAEMLRAEYARDRRFEWLCELFGASGAAMGRRLHAVI